MTEEQILTKLGYQEAGVEYDNQVILKISDYIEDNNINLSDLNYRENHYKVIGTLYKYYYILKEGTFEAGELDVNDDGHYSNLFWKL